VYLSSVAWSELYNDGKLDILLAGTPDGSTYITKIYGNNATLANTVPGAPSGISASVSGSSATLHWNKNHPIQKRPQNGLSYISATVQLRGGINTLSPMANVNNGYRKVVRLGNTNQQDTTWTEKICLMEIFIGVFRQ